jgi:spore maturation protein CgeB
MHIVYFTHSLVSCWNHGNAHFVRGLLRELGQRGHSVVAYEPADGWSRQHLINDHGEAPLHAFKAAFPNLQSRQYQADCDLAAMLDGADLVLVHEWIDPALASAIGKLRRMGGRFVLLFHDTHHRAISDPEAMHRFDLSNYDAVLAFGDSLAEVYRQIGWGSRVFTFHEAADTGLFSPPLEAETNPRAGIVWVGNWGDDERSREISDYLLQPARRCQLSLDVYGVRYPASVLRLLQRYDVRYRGWIANCDVPALFAKHQMTLHIPRRPYRGALHGIPTIRVFEALACGIPLLCAPWRDSEGLFRAGRDFLLARDPSQMRRHMRAVASDGDLQRELARNGLECIQKKHTCAHRADELLRIAAALRPQPVGASLCA